MYILLYRLQVVAAPKRFDTILRYYNYMLHARELTTRDVCCGKTNFFYSTEAPITCRSNLYINIFYTSYYCVRVVRQHSNSWNVICSSKAVTRIFAHYFFIKHHLTLSYTFSFIGFCGIRCRSFYSINKGDTILYECRQMCIIKGDR